MATPPTFSAGAVLTAAQMNQLGLFLVKSQAVGTGVSTVTVTDAFSADFDNYKIIYSGGSTSSAVLIGLQLVGSSTGYYGFFVLGSYNSPTVGGAGVNNLSTFQYGGVGTPSNAMIDADILNPFLAKTTGFTCSYMQHTATTGSGGNFNGFHNVASSFTDFVINAGAATFTGGTIRVYGYRN
jgi:hypothetical protein